MKKNKRRKNEQELVELCEEVRIFVEILLQKHDVVNICSVFHVVSAELFIARTQDNPNRMEDFITRSKKVLKAIHERRTAQDSIFKNSRRKQTV